MDSLADLDTSIEDDGQFSIELAEADDDDDEYHPRLRNSGQVQQRKFTGYDQKLPMVVYGLREATVHGTSAGGEPYTLVVFRWNLRQRHPGHRFQWVSIKVRFQTTRRVADGSGIDAFYDPNVVTVVPDAENRIGPTPVEVARKVGGEVGVEAGVDVAKVTAKMMYELSTSVTAEDQIVISGIQRSEYEAGDEDGDPGDPDRCNIAEWNLKENSSTRSGLPSLFRTAVLLERRSMDCDHFMAKFTISAKIDSLTDARIKLKRLFGRLPKDSAVIFDPNIVETGPFNEYKDALDTAPLKKECKFVMFRTDTDSLS